MPSTADTSRDIEPLEVEFWFEQVSSLLGQQIDTESDVDVESSLRRAFYLLLLAPTPLKPYIHSTLEEQAFERLLECEAFESAALGLISEGAGIQLSRQLDSGVFEANTWFNGQSQDSNHASSSCAAHAILCSWLTSINALWQSASEVRSRPDHQTVHLVLHRFQA